MSGTIESHAANRIKDYSILAQQELLFTTALMLSFTSYLGVVLLVLPYIPIIVSLWRSPRLSMEDEAYIRDTAGISRNIYIRQLPKGPSTISLPFLKVIFVPKDIVSNTNRDKLKLILEHEKGHLRSIDFFIFYGLPICCAIYLYKNLSTLPQLIFHCQIDNPAEPIIENIETWKNWWWLYTTDASSEWYIFNTASALSVVALIIISNNLNFIKSTSLHMRLLFNFSSFILMVLAFSGARIFYFSFNYCGNAAWDLSVGKPQETLMMISQTNLFWSSVTTVFCLGALYMLGRILRRREFMADSFAVKEYGASYIAMLSERAKPKPWQNSIVENVFGKWFTRIIYPSWTQRQKLQESPKQLNATQLAIGSLVWTFVISLVFITYYFDIVARESIDIQKVTFTRRALGEILILITMVYISIWVQRVSYQRNRTTSLLIFLGIFIGAFSAQFLFIYIDFAVHERGRPMIHEALDIGRLLGGYFITIFLGSWVFFAKHRYRYLAPLIGLFGISMGMGTFLAPSTIGEPLTASSFPNLYLGFTLLFATVPVFAIIRGLDFLLVLLTGQKSPRPPE